MGFLPNGATIGRRKVDSVGYLLSMSASTRGYVVLFQGLLGLYWIDTRTIMFDVVLSRFRCKACAGIM